MMKFIDRLTYLYLLISCSLLVACGRTAEKPAAHPLYFDQVFARTNRFSTLQTEEAFAYVDSAYAAFPDAGSMDLARKYEYKLDHYWHNLKAPGKAGPYADSILQLLAGKTQWPEYAVMYGKTLLYRGEMLMKEGKRREASVYFYQGRSYIHQSGDTCSFNEYSGRLGAISFMEHRFDEAAAWFRTAFFELASCRSDPFYKFKYQQGELDNIGLCYQQMGLHDSALFYYDSTLKYIAYNSPAFMNEPGHARFIQEAIAVVKGNKGALHLAAGDSAMAEKLYLENIRTNLEGGHETRNAQITITQLAGLLLAQKRYKDADTWLLRMRASLDNVPDRNNELEWHKLRSKHYAATSRHDQALASLLQYVAIKDSAHHADNVAASIDIQAEIDHVSNEFENHALKKKNDIKTTYLYITLCFSGMVIIILYLIWRNWQESKKHVMELNRLNRQIMIQHEQMGKSLSALEQSQLDNSRMMKIVAHDLRNPVGAMITLSELIWLNDNKKSAEIYQLLTMMRESGEKALGLISELLYLNVITKIQMEPLQIDVVLQYCVDLLRMKAKEKGQEIVLNPVPVTLMANREKIWRVFSNLITNALKFSNNGAVITVYMSVARGMMRISVKDEGIGIPAAMKDRIFSMTGGAGRAGTQGEESFGLGLAISKQIVESHGGKIWFESEEGKGAVFHVELRMSNAN